MLWTTFSPFLSCFYLEAPAQCVHCSCNDKSFPTIPNMPGFHWTKVVWALAKLQLVLCDSQYVLQYIVMYTTLLRKSNFSNYITFFSSLSTNTSGVTTATTMAAAGRNCPLAPHMRPCAPHRHVKWMGDNSPSKWVYFWGVYGPWSAPLFRQCTSPQPCCRN